MLVIHQYHLKEMKTQEIKTVKLRSVVQLCNLEAVGFQWMVAKIVCQVVESVLSFSELTHALKSPISDRFGASTTMNQRNCCWYCSIFAPSAARGLCYILCWKKCGRFCLLLAGSH